MLWKAMKIALADLKKWLWNAIKYVAGVHSKSEKSSYIILHPCGKEYVRTKTKSCVSWFNRFGDKSDVKQTRDSIQWIIFTVLDVAQGLQTDEAKNDYKWVNENRKFWDDWEGL